MPEKKHELMLKKQNIIKRTMTQTWTCNLVSETLSSHNSRYWDLLHTSKLVYDSCMNEEEIEKTGYAVYKSQVEEKITGYPLGEHYWRKSYFDPNEMVKKRHNNCIYWTLI